MMKEAIIWQKQKYSFYPKTIVQWNLLLAAAVQCPTLDIFKEQIPLSVLQQHI